MRVAAIVPVFRRPRLVLEALESARCQTMPPARLVVVDDGSDDGSADAVEAWGREVRPAAGFEVLRRPHRGVGAARNAGVLCVPECDALAFLDSDNLWEPEFLARTSAALARDPAAVGVVTDRWRVDLATGRRRRERLDAVDGARARDLLRGPPGTSNTLLRAAAFRAVGGYDEDLTTAEDLHLMLRLGLRGPLRHVPEVLAVRRDAAGEEPQIGKHHPDRRAKRLEAIERFLFRDGGAEAVPRRAWGPWLARVRAALARHRFREGRRDEARRLARGAVEAWPWSPGAWLQRLR